MALVIRSPYHGLRGFRGLPGLRIMDYGKVTRRDHRRAWNPRVDVMRSRDSIKYRVGLPGAAAEDVDVTARGDVLTIKGRRTEERRLDRDGYEWHEHSESTFSRSLELPEDADTEGAYATLGNDVLEITVPYREPAKPVHIDIASAGKRESRETESAGRVDTGEQESG